MNSDMTIIISAVFGALVSIVFTYVPKLREKYAGMDETLKRVIMLSILIGAALLIAASSCLNLWSAMECNKMGFMDLAKAIYLAIVANQTTFLITPKPTDVRAARGKG